MAVHFRKRRIDNVKYEACAVFDVNNDGFVDIISGEYWYEGPAFEQKHSLLLRLLGSLFSFFT